MMKLKLVEMRKIQMTSNFDQENKLWLFMDKDDEHKYFDEVCDRIIRNTRFYLDNIQELHTFRVSFINYSSKKSKSL